MRRSLRLWILAACVLTVGAGAGVFTAAAEGDAAPEKVLDDDWYAIYQSDRKIGYQHSWMVERTVDGQVVYVSREHTVTEMKRGESHVEFVGHTRTVEDAAGRLIEFSTEEIQGGLPRVTEGKVEDGQLKLTISTGESVTTQSVPAPRGLCDQGVNRAVMEAGFAAGTQYTLGVFQSGHPTREVRLKVVVGPREEVRIGDETRELHRLDLTVSTAQGLKVTVWVDGDGAAWLHRAESGTIVREVRKTTRELATGPNEPVDAMAASRVRADKSIRRARRLELLRILLRSVEEGGTVPDVPPDAYQDSRKVEGGVEVTVRRAHPSARNSYEIPYAGAEHAELLRPTIWLETASPVIKKMAAEAIGSDTDAMRVAVRLERYVRRTIKSKNMSLAMATAAETADRKTGDCSEHAVLLAALARAVGMPSRVVVGLAYSQPGPDEGFEYHMWTEVFAGEWVPLDAALFGHDATHIAIARSKLEEQDLLELDQALNRYLGKVRVEILEMSHERSAARTQDPD